MDIPKYSVSNILVVQIGKLGDMILTTPLFHELKRLYPNAKLTVLASDLNQNILKEQSVINEVLIYKKSFLPLLKLLFTLKNRRYDLWIDPKNEKSDTSRFLMKYAKPVNSLGYNFGDKVYDIDLTNKELGNHAVDIYLTPIKALDPAFVPAPKTPVMEIPGEVKNSIKALLPGSSNNIFINLSAGQPARHWEIDNWIAVINEINSLGEYTFLLNAFGINEADLSLLKTSIQGKYILVDHLSQLEIAEAIRNSMIVISPDTSAVHFASGFNIPVIDLMNNVPWNIERFAPLSEKQKILISNDENTLKSITPENVITAFKELSK